MEREDAEEGGPPQRNPTGPPRTQAHFHAVWRERVPQHPLQTQRGTGRKQTTDTENGHGRVGWAGPESRTI